MSRIYALLVPSYEAHGIVRDMLNLAEGLMARGDTVDLVVVRGDGEVSSPRPAGMGLVSLRVEPDEPPARPLAQYLRAERPHTLFSTTHGVNLAAISARQRIELPMRLVVSVRRTVSEIVKAKPGQAQRLRRQFNARYPLADCIHAVSDGVANDLARVTGLPRKRIAVVPEPVVTPAFLRRIQAPIDHPWFAAAAPPVVLAMGRLLPRRNFGGLIRAFAKIHARRPMRLIILGEGRARPRLENLARELGVAHHIALPGFLANPFAYLREAAVLAAFAGQARQTRLVIGAMACATPVGMIGTRGFRPAVHDSLNLVPRVPAGDDSALSSAIESMMTEPPTQAALRAGADPFTSAHYLERMMSLLDGDAV